VRAVLPVDDDGVLPADADGVLPALVAVALDEDDALFFGLGDGVDEDLPEAAEEDDEDDEEDEETEAEADDDADEEAEDEDDEEDAAGAVACAADWLPQVGCGLGGTVLLGGAVELGLLLGSSLPDDVSVGVDVGLGLPLADCVPVVVGLGLALELELAVLPLLWLPLGDVAGALVVWVDLLGELVVLCDADGCAEGDVQAVVLAPGTTTGKLDEPPPGVPGGALLAPAPLGLLAGPTRAALMAW
jgi:hypothetical protein